jgi:hypothetical protein
VGKLETPAAANCCTPSNPSTRAADGSNDAHVFCIAPLTSYAQIWYARARETTKPHSGARGRAVNPSSTDFEHRCSIH